MSNSYDIAIIGGGVNGCGIARDAAGRGLKVLLAEKSDLASGTSSASTKLVHGGLRYLEHYEFKMVHDALAEREVLLGMAPHIIWPLRFVLPHHSALRPAALIRIGLFLYDHLGGRKFLPSSRGIDLRGTPEGRPLKDNFTRGFEYSDCWVDDARLVVLNAMDAKTRGADIRTRTEVVSAREESGRWQLTLQTRDPVTGALERRETLQSRALVNAGGPWVDDVLNKRVGKNGKARIRLVKGSHIVVPRLFEHDKAYICQNDDRRIVFAIPYETDFTLIGTTDIDYRGDPGQVKIESGEIEYLCRLASTYFRKPITPADVVWTYSGVRPLMDDGATAAQEATRDYVLELDPSLGAPLLNVFGGKITTFRHLSEEAMDKLGRLVGGGKAWTAGATLPGGDFPITGFDALVGELAQSPAIDRTTARRLARSYGTKARLILAGAKAPSDLGIAFGGGLTEREVRYLIEHEWARTADDILWRRSKLGLRLSKTEAAALADWLARNAQNVA